MIEHDVHHYTDTAAVSLCHKPAHLVDCAHIAVHEGPVERIVAVECVMWEGIAGTARPAMHLLIRSCDPDGVDSEFVKIIKLLGQSRYIAAMVCGHISASRLFLAMIAFVIALVAIIETVGQHEIHIGVLPGEVIFTHHLRGAHRDCVGLCLGTVAHSIHNHILAAAKLTECVVGIGCAVDGDIHDCCL